MTKAEIVAQISEKTGIERVAVAAIIEETMVTIKDSLTHGENVYLRGFGTFGIIERKEKLARNITKNTAISGETNTASDTTLLIASELDDSADALFLVGTSGGRLNTGNIVLSLSKMTLSLGSSTSRINTPTTVAYSLLKCFNDGILSLATLAVVGADASIVLGKSVVDASSGVLQI